MKKVVDYVVVLADGVRKRHIHETERGTVVRFVVQLEFRMELEWLPVVRYDNAHGFAHRDVYHGKSLIKKESLDLGLEVALNYGDWDINENWQNYIAHFKTE